jgi:hypothetical protein
MRVFKTKCFDRFARKRGISDTKLIGITTDLEQGRWGADLGGNVYKIRLARPGEGKSGGYRTIVIFRSGERAFSITDIRNPRGILLKTTSLPLLRMRQKNTWH